MLCRCWRSSSGGGSYDVTRLEISRGWRVFGTAGEQRDPEREPKPERLLLRDQRLMKLQDEQSSACLNYSGKISVSLLFIQWLLSQLSLFLRQTIRTTVWFHFHFNILKSLTGFLLVKPLTSGHHITHLSWETARTCSYLTPSDIFVELTTSGYLTSSSSHKDFLPFAGWTTTRSVFF